MGAVHLRSRFGRNVQGNSACRATTLPHATSSNNLPYARLIAANVRRDVRLHAQENEVATDLFAENQGFLRSLPLVAGSVGVFGLLANRFLSAAPLVMDASSGQSRADVLGIVLSAVLLLTGLQWLALRPKPPAVADLDGVELFWLNGTAKLPSDVSKELRWSWQSLKQCSRATSFVCFYRGVQLFHGGQGNPAYTPGTAVAGDVCSNTMRTGKGEYLANLVLYPGRAEFTAFLPESTQGVVVQPVGSEGVLVVGTHTVRGLSQLDQVWIASLADKLENTLGTYSPLTPGRGFAAKSAKNFK